MAAKEEPAAPSRAPKNAVVILLDSLNRHMLGAYGGREFATPNLDRFAGRSTRFTRHFTGSLPCMPARHDILCGALDFLWRPWGSVEIWEDAITCELRKKGIVTQLISDHPHLFETGGENYHVDFTAWDYQRGHEGDPWKTRPDPSWAGAPNFMRKHMPYDDSRGYFHGEEDFPGPRTMGAAARWLSDNAGHHDRFMLFVDEFDPHEPFDTPEPYASMYDADWEGAHLIWPPYVNGGIEKGVITERQARQIRASYGGKLTMIDKWFGKIMDELDRHDLWKDTLVILCTDHGHYLGEKDIWGKPGVPVYEPLGHIPLMIAHPDVAPGTCDALTTGVDLFATLADLFGVAVRQRTHGRSLLPLMRNETASIRDWVLTGVWGREVHYIDGRFKYARGPAGDNAPLTMMSNRWSTMPTHVLAREQELPLPDERAFLDRMPGSGVPVIHQQWDKGDPVPFWALTRFSGHHLYDLEEDPSEERNLAGTPREADMAERLRAALLELEAPGSQLIRLGLGR
ncbi:sulfatase [Parvibaculum sp.]|uniref:sulfatase n=1 Tax=Parvibaculum sp. TaxID=2024848 RepID=UPI00272FE0EA|nr:sulfatase [Parvibaculum sp.]MDP1628008.1 sulfatase [Parvibaculum sp.]MDP2151007.1 sulfatase [Parvibaculum sp.]MDP3330141.1 sulfatase [Parvibaculum sp.]